MTKTDCEGVRMAAMAPADGYESELSPEQIATHLTDCVECRREVGELRALESLLESQERRQQTENIWKSVQQKLPAASTPRTSRRALRALVVLGALLVGYRLVEMIPDRALGFVFKLVPVLFVIAAFGYLRENPFKIDGELRLEGE